MPKGYPHLTRDQRCQLYTVKSSGKSANETATILGVHISTVYRELSRNQGLKGYRYEQAHEKALERRRTVTGNRVRMISERIPLIESKLRLQWSPEQISGWLKRHHHSVWTEMNTRLQFDCSLRAHGFSMLRWAALLCNSFFVLCLALSTTATIAMLPTIQNELQLSPILARWLLSGNIGMGAIVILWVGTLGDRWGSFRVLAGGLLGFSLTSTWVALSQDGMSTVIARTLQGIAAATISAQALASVQILFIGPQRARAVVTWGTFVSIGFGMGAWVAGMISAWFSWRYFFGLLASITAFGAILNLFFAKKFSVKKQLSSLDGWSFLLFVAMIIPIVLWLLTGASLGWFSWVSGLYLLCMVVFFLLFLWRACQGPDAHRYRVLAHHSYFRLSLILFFTVLFSLIGFFYFYNRFVQSPWGYALTSLQSGESLFPTNLTMMISMSLVPWLGRRDGGMERILCVGYCCIAIGMFVFAGLTLCPLSRVHYLPQILIGAGFGLTFPTVPFLALQALPNEVQGRASGLLNTVNYLGGCAAVALGSAIFLVGGSPHTDLGIRELDQLLFGCQGVIPDLEGQGLACNFPRALCYGFRLFLLVCGILSTASGFLVWNKHRRAPTHYL